MMRAVLQDNPGDENTLYVGEIPIPSPGEREVLIRVHCAALNRMDLLQRRGLYPVPKGASPILGVEVSGYIEQIGSNCTGKFQIGDRCMALLQGGGYAEYAVAYESCVMLAPQQLDMKVLASIPEQWMTAYQLLFLIGKLQSNESVLLHAGASSVGQAAIQLARHHCNAIIHVTCRSEEKVKYCLELGANYVYNLSDSSNFLPLIQQNISSNENMINLILDPVGSLYSQDNIDCLAMDGRWILYGTMGGKNLSDPNILGKILGKRISLIGTTLRSRTEDYKRLLIDKIEKEVLLEIINGNYHVRVDCDYPMTTEGVQEAHRKMELNQNIGKIILMIKEEN